MGVETLKEGTTDTKCTSTGDRLSDGDVIEDRGGGAVGKGRSGLGEGRYTGDAGILFVQLFGDETLLGSADGGEDVRLAGVVAVGADSEVDFFGEGIGFEGFSDPWEGVSRAVGVHVIL